MKPLSLTISEPDKISLYKIIKYEKTWRIRERAQTILSLATGISCTKVANQIGLCRATVETTRKSWIENKFESFKDRSRSGAPRKINRKEVLKILKNADEKPMSATDLLKIHIENGGKEVHVATIRALLKREGRVWKRTRHSLKGERCDDAFETKKQEIDLLIERAKKGEIVLASLDEAGFSCVHPNRNAWTKIGFQHLIPAVRGRRVNVLAALMSTGHLEDYIFTGSMTSKIFIEFIQSTSEKYDKHIVFILDNARIHKSKEVEVFLKNSENKNFSLCFLSTYSPELNRIEKLWHTVKHCWMDVRCRKTEEVEATLCNIFDNFGSKFKFNFYAK